MNMRHCFTTLWTDTRLRNNSNIRYLILTYSNKDENSEFLSKTFHLKRLKCETEERFYEHQWENELQTWNFTEPGSHQKQI